MKVAIMQPYFFPYIGYFQLINAVDTFVMYDDVNFIKKGWINRNNILVGGKQFLFTIPLKEASQNRRINQITVDEKSAWKIDLLKTIKVSYSKAPFFQQAFPLIKDILEFEETHISKLVYYSLKKICSFLHIETHIAISSDIEKNNNLKGEEKIIEICKKLNATSYINSIGGMTLYDKNTFLDNDITLSFIKCNDFIYPQFKNEFIPYLSIIDVLMFNSSDRIKEFLNQYDSL